MNIRITQIDGKLPNIALMRLAAWHRAKGDTVDWNNSLRRSLFDPPYDRVYASSIFDFSRERVRAFRQEFPSATVGGTGVDLGLTLESVVGRIPQKLDYSDHPTVKYSIGFLQRGCRLKCGFCVVPKKEGRPRATQRIHELWRGEPHDRKLHILDNDFFGVPEWREHIDDIRDGGFRVCLSQGINVRLINEEASEALASIEYRNSDFNRRRLYTAWDNIGQEKVFFKGVDMLESAGIPPKHLMAYMLIGYDPAETFERIQYRFDRMVSRGILPYPMVFDNERKDLKRFQRWAVTGLYRAIPFSEYQSRQMTSTATRAVDGGIVESRHGTRLPTS